MANTVSDPIVEGLIDWGVNTVFGLPGDGINGFVEALRKAKDRVRYIHTRHEEVPVKTLAVLVGIGLAAVAAGTVYAGRRSR
jgi:glyoxylate carboligase